MRRFDKVKVYDAVAVAAQRLKEDLEPEISVDIEAVASAEKAVRDSDLLVTVTTAKEPILSVDWLKPGVHLNAVGSHRPDLREMDGATLKHAKLVVDSREAVMAECGDILLAIQEKSITKDDIHAELGEVLAGKASGRTSAEEITVYKTVGIAVQDVATAYLVYRKAIEKKSGVTVEI